MKIIYLFGWFWLGGKNSEKVCNLFNLNLNYLEF